MVTGVDGALAPSSEHGLLVINHGYTDDGLLHPDGMKTWTAARSPSRKPRDGDIGDRCARKRSAGIVRDRPYRARLGGHHRVR
jgi:hypothetical protein